MLKGIRFPLFSTLLVATTACGGAMPSDHTKTQHQAAHAGQNSETHIAFSNPGFEWTWAAAPGVELNHIWIQGDSWAQTFRGTPLSFATHMSLNLNISGDSFISNTIGVNIVLNGTVVGTATLGPNMLGDYGYEVFFDPVQGPDYRLEIIATNSNFEGCIAIAVDGPSYATLSN